MHSERVLQQLFLRAVILQPQIQKSLLLFFFFSLLIRVRSCSRRLGRRYTKTWLCLLSFRILPSLCLAVAIPFLGRFPGRGKKQNHQKRKKRFNDNSDKRLSNAGRVKTITASPPNFWLSLYLKKLS